MMSNLFGTGVEGEEFSDFISATTRIVNVVDTGSNDKVLNLNTENLKNLLTKSVSRLKTASEEDDLPSLEDMPVGLISVVSGSSSEQSFFTRLLVHYFGVGGQGWMNMMETSNKVNGTNLNLQSDHNKELGVYLWPEPFVMQGDHRSGDEPGKNAQLVFILHVTGSREEIQGEVMETFLSLACSKLVEIFPLGESPRSFNAREQLGFGDDGFPPFKNFSPCKSISCIVQLSPANMARPLTFQKPVMKGAHAHTYFEKHDINNLDLFDHISIVQVHGVTENFRISQMVPALMPIANMITGCKDFPPKMMSPAANGNYENLTLKNMVAYFESIIDVVNDFTKLHKPSTNTITTVLVASPLPPLQPPEIGPTSPQPLPLVKTKHRQTLADLCDVQIPVSCLSIPPNFEVDVDNSVNPSTTISSPVQGCLDIRLTKILTTSQGTQTEQVEYCRTNIFGLQIIAGDQDADVEITNVEPDSNAYQHSAIHTSQDTKFFQAADGNISDSSMMEGSLPPDSQLSGRTFAHPLETCVYGESEISENETKEEESANSPCFSAYSALPEIHPELCSIWNDLFRMTGTSAPDIHHEVAVAITNSANLSPESEPEMEEDVEYNFDEVPECNNVYAYVEALWCHWVSQYMSIHNSSHMSYAVLDAVLFHNDEQRKNFAESIQQVEQCANGFISGMESKFDNFVCFYGIQDEDKFKSFLEMERTRALDSLQYPKCENEDNEFYINLTQNMAENVCAKIQSLFCSINEKIILNETTILRLIIQNLVTVYDQRIPKFAKKSPDQLSSYELEEIHERLIRRLLRSMETSMEFSGRRSGIISKGRDTLETSLKQKLKIILENRRKQGTARHGGYGAFQRNTRIPLQGYQNTQHSSRGNHHQVRVEQVPPKSPDRRVESYDQPESQLDWLTILECYKLYKTDLNTTMKSSRDNKMIPTQGDVEYWGELTRRSLKSLRQYNALKDCEKSVVKCLVDHYLVRACEQSEIANMTLEHFHSPLIIHINSNSTVDSALFNDAVGYSVLPNRKGELRTCGGIVRLLAQNNYLFGTDAATAINSGQVMQDQYWKLLHIIRVDDKRQDCTWEWNKSVLASFLGYLNHIPLDNIVIAIPDWLTLNQRRVLRDSAKLARFASVFLVNETTAAAFACFMERFQRKEGLVSAARCDMDKDKPLVIFTEFEGRYQVSIFEIEREAEKPSSENPIQLIAFATGGNNAKEKSLLSKIQDIQWFGGQSSKSDADSVYSLACEMFKNYCERNGKLRLVKAEKEVVVFAHEPGKYSLIEDAVGNSVEINQGKNWQELVIQGAAELGSQPEKIHMKVLDFVKVGQLDKTPQVHNVKQKKNPLTGCLQAAQKPKPPKAHAQGASSSVAFKFSSFKSSQGTTTFQHAYHPPPASQPVGIFREDEWENLSKHDVQPEKSIDPETAKAKETLGKKCVHMKCCIDSGKVTFVLDTFRETTLQQIEKAEAAASSLKSSLAEVQEQDRNLDKLMEVYEFE